MRNKNLEKKKLKIIPLIPDHRCLWKCCPKKG